MTTERCPECGQEGFETQQGLNLHRTRFCDETPPWRDEERLREMHHEEGLSHSEISERLGCERSTVTRMLGEFGIASRTPKETFALRRASTPALFRTRQEDGYEYWQSEDDWVYAHRLLAVAEYGFDAVVASHIHHGKRGGRLPPCEIPWANWPGNLEPLSNADHRSRHAKLSWLDRIAIAEKYQNGNLSHRDLGEIYGVNNSNITRSLQKVEQAGERF